MRKRIHKVANFLAFNLLFFALYLNFIYKDPAVPVAEKNHQEAASASSGTLTDENPEKKQVPVTIIETEAAAPSKGTN